MKWNRNISKNNLIFLIAYGLFILSVTLEYTNLRYVGDSFLQLMRYGAYALFVLKILLDSVSEKKKIFFVGCLVIITFLQSYVSGVRELFFFLLIIMALRDVDIENAFKIQILIQLSVLLLVVSFCILGVIPNTQYMDHGKLRNTLGFAYIHDAGSMIFRSQIPWLYIRRDKLKIGEVLGFLIAWGIIYYFTDFRTLTLLGCAGVILCYLNKFLKLRVDKMPLSAFFKSFSLLVAGATWGLQLYYNRHNTTTLMKRIDSIFNGRLQLAKNAIENYGLDFLGEKVKWIGNTDNLARNKYNFVDCSYIKTAIEYGIIIAVIIILIYCYLFYRLVQMNHYNGCIMLMLFMIGAIMLPMLTGVYYNALLLLAGDFLYERRKVHQT